MTNIKNALYIALGVVFIALVIATLWFRSQTISAQSDLQQVMHERDLALMENTRQALIIDKMQSLSQFKDQVIADYTSQLTLIQTQADQTNQQLKELKENDETSRTFMALDLPDGIRSLLNNK